MTSSAKLGVPFTNQNQSSPEVTHNEAILMMSAFQVGVESIGLNTPPVSPSEGDCYIVGPSPSGAWAGRGNAIAISFLNGWRFVPGNDTSGAIIPMGAEQEGLRAWDKSGNGQLYWSGSSWETTVSIPAEPMKFGQKSVSLNTTAIAVPAAVDSTLATNSDYVQVTGIYNPIPDGNNYEITQQTNSFTITKSGFYRTEFWCNAKSNVNNTQLAFKFAVNGTIGIERRPSIYMRNVGEIHPGSAFGYQYLNAGDVITLWIASTTNANITIQDMVFGAQSMTNGPTNIDQLVEYLSELADVEIDSSLTNGQILAYDSVDGLWKNVDPSAASAFPLEDLTNVDIDNGLSDGQFLAYDELTDTYKNSDQLVNYKEKNGTASDGLFSITDGSIQDYTLTADESFTFDLLNGQSLTLHLNGGATWTVTWPVITWIGGVEPTLTNADVLTFWRFNGTLFASYIGSVA